MQMQKLIYEPLYQIELAKLSLRFCSYISQLYDSLSSGTWPEAFPNLQGVSGYEASSDLKHVAKLSWSWDVLGHVGKKFE
jgi:hypothetical protein